jgi:hypothetical protein
MTTPRTGRVAAAVLLALLSFTGSGCATLGTMIGGATGFGMQAEPTPTSVKGASPSDPGPAHRPAAGKPRR